MNCQHCGAPLQLVPHRDFFVCGHCDSLYHPDPNRDGLKLLEEPSGVACPVCREELVAGSVDRIRVQACSHCLGILTDNSGLLHFLRFVDVEPGAAELPPRPLRPEELARRVACPSCDRKMDTHPYSGPGNVVIDSCANCGLVFLDHGELDAITRANARENGLRQWRSTFIEES